MFLFCSRAFVLGVLVVAAPPDARLVTPPWCAVEPLVHTPEDVQSPRIGGVSVVHDAVFEYERAHTRPLTRVRRHVGSGHCRVLGDRPLAAFRQRFADPVYRPCSFAPVVVLRPLKLLLLSERDIEVEIEV